MPVIDLTRYIVASSGTWTDPQAGSTDNQFHFARADTYSPERLLLRWAGDFVALTGPLRVKVTVQSENITVPLAYVGQFVPDTSGSISSAGLPVGVQRGGLSLQASTIYSYTLDIGAGQAWPFSLSEELNRRNLQSFHVAGVEQLGNNLGFRVIIESAFAVTDGTPITPSTDLPCDFAVADRPDTARFFPAACEPCEASVIGLPPAGSVAHVTPPADGGCIRTRFFNGMFITQEDLETEQRYHRLKSKLHNRAAGAGVVWGFGVGKQGSQVWVLPGYGVDCCGNDLTLTTTYKVEIAALLTDPAAARLVQLRGPQRLHLLLEYVECPTNPRPVHGDPCAPEVNRCEMSRIRESVRLRLVPPRDYDVAKESAPLQRFLDEVRDLRQRFKLEQITTAVGTVRAPFTMDITVENTQGQSQNISGLRPSSDFNNGQLQFLVFTSAAKINVSVKLDPLWTFVRGILAGDAFAREDGSIISGIVQVPASRDLSLTNASNSPPLEIAFDLEPSMVGRLDRIIFRISSWQAQNLFATETDPAPSGDLTLTFRISDTLIQGVELVEAPISVQSLSLSPNPCSGEPCVPRRRSQPSDMFDRSLFNNPSQTATDPTPVLPWLHTDPVHPSAAGDPKALILAAIGGWLMQMQVREGTGTANAVNSSRRQIAQAIYHLAWLLLFGLQENADTATILGKTLQRLLEGWCDEFLWKGPECCGEPHGIVIGCAVVEGGTIQNIDPFGGRRYVVHYPLLAHWGAQFGIAPLDISLIRLFSKLCCIAGLPALGVKSPEVTSSLVAFGRGYLAVGTPAKIAEEIRNRANQIQIVEQRPVATAEMIASALTLIGARQSERNTRFTALVLSDFVAEGTVMLLLPRSERSDD